MEHSPTPWKIGDTFTKSIFSGDTLIVGTYNTYSDIPAEANARFIVKAVNCHDYLVELLQGYIEHFDNPYWSDLAVKEWLDDTWIPEVRQALSRAEGE